MGFYNENKDGKCKEIMKEKISKELTAVSFQEFCYLRTNDTTAAMWSQILLIVAAGPKSN